MISSASVVEVNFKEDSSGEWPLADREQREIWEDQLCLLGSSTRCWRSLGRFQRRRRRQWNYLWKILSHPVVLWASRPPPPTPPTPALCLTAQALFRFGTDLYKLLPDSQSPFISDSLLSGAALKKGVLTHAWLWEEREGEEGEKGISPPCGCSCETLIPAFPPFESSLSFRHLQIAVCHLVYSLCFNLLNDVTAN